ncbi:hypothetical protein CONCODRAFT_80029 [Conidiobolus coronatus NRRL 28638]|uniref:Uncharacterized protein n=1 Tax=Conidiobolus coronatus (strain ATCC 28846 / CBS 209.66 / NRRL 28638) TaxID=796925 RepID=A0A137NXU7_CONC2|nr:hypothetical protein CONCODRAFT_80029 [Conidiobolus coronatus NRRL 28638]|eukprot:KXN67700.1 hypothetical protein CONCODRAFT_80029 [Conidiobolus coronatus NRRL 28638]
MDENRLENKLNVQELQSTKLKIAQIRDSLSEFYNMINFNDQQMANWTDVFTKYNILVAKYLNLTDELTNFNYKKLFLHPDQALSEDLQIRAVGTLLRTKQIPQVEDLQMKNIQSCLSQYKELDDSKLPDNDTRVLGDVLARWQQRIKRLNARVEKVLAIFEEARETSQYKRRPEKRPLPSKDSDTSAPTTPTNVEENKDAEQQPPPVKKPNIAVSAPKTLDQMMRWLSQGVKE